MSLEDLNKNLYGSNNDELSQRRHAPEQFDPSKKTNAGASPFDEQQRWGKADKGMTSKQKKILYVIFGAILLFLVSVGAYAGYQWFKNNAFHQDRVEVFFEGPTDADSTQMVQYLIHYKNNNSVTLKNATIVLDYSENFQPTDNVNLKYLSATSSKLFVGDIKPRADQTTSFKGIFYAPKDFPVYLHATLQYVPSNGLKQLENKNQLAVNITNSPVLLEVTSPETVADGDTVEYVIDYKNLDISPLKDAQVRIVFPSGFEFSDSSPAASEGQIAWYLGSLEANQGGQIRIHGYIHGANDESKVVRVSLGHMGSDGQFALYNQREKSSKMVAALLTISQALEDSGSNTTVQPGEMLKYIIKYQNTSNIGLRNVIITEQLKSSVLDFSQLKMDKGAGAFDSAKNTITWKASDIPQLASIAPQESGIIRFSVPVKSIIPVSDASSKNFTVDSIAKIDSPDIPTPIGSNKIVGSNTLLLKVGSKIIFDSSGFFYDALLANSGSLPMMIGKETTFTLHWGITNVSNDISSVKVSASLPTGIRWVGKISPENENITYDERTNQITWNIGGLSAGVGILSPKREIAFQVGLTPQPNQAGSIPALLNAPTLTAHDDFTGQAITANGSQITTELHWDTRMDASLYQVQR